MFTGIIQEIGTVARIQRQRGILRLTVDAPKTASQVRHLESISVSGACLTVVDVKRGRLAFEIIPETQRLTSLALLRPGSRVNLEPSLSLSDRLNGHVVLGHVDATGRILKRKQLSGERVLWIGVAPALRRLLVPKGPVTVEGVSLTVGVNPTKTAFSIHLIPETLRQTTLGSCRAGDRVNIEIDYLAKLLRQWTAGSRST